MHLIWRGFKSIAPRGEPLYREPFPEWYDRVKGRIPHVPRELAEDWLYRNWDGSPYWWLPLANLRFERQRWLNEEISRIGVSLDRRTVEYWSSEFGREGSAHRNTWLGRYMAKHWTWPAPILVLDNVDESIADSLHGPLARYHLIEGHMRFAFHHQLATTGQALPDHDVWAVRVVRRR